MIPIIGLMVGAYIIVRMVSFITRKGDQEETTLVKVLCILNIIVTLLLLGLLMGTSTMK